MKKIWVAIIVIVVLIGAALIYVATRDGDMPYTQNTNQQSQTDDTTPEQSTEEQENQYSEGQYIDYNEDLLASADGRKWIFFHAPWCPQCRALETDILEKGVPAGLTIFKIDYDTSTAERQKYGVTLQTTIVEVDDDGNEIAKFVAYDDPSLAAALNALGE